MSYPFKSFDGAVTLDRSHAGQRTWDINVDGVAHYGLYPDWVQDLRNIAGDEIVQDMGRGSEAYLQMWERAVGVWDPGCRNARLRFTPRGVALERLGDSAEDVLRGAGQPLTRQGRTYGYCVKGTPAARLTTVMDPAGKAALVVSTAPRHRVAGLGKGSRAAAIRGGKAFGPGLVVRSAGGGKRYFYGVKGGRIRFAGVAAREAATTRARLRSYLGIAGVA